MDHQDEEILTYLTQLESSPDKATKDGESHLRSQIRAAEKELYHLDVDLALILAKRARIIRRIQRCRTYLAPYSKLPTELIRKIIRLCGPYRGEIPRVKGYPPYPVLEPNTWRAWGDPRLVMICLGGKLHLAFQNCGISNSEGRQTAIPLILRDPGSNKALARKFC